MKNLLRRFARDRRGATAIEYALIAGLIFVAIIGAVTLFSEQVGAVYARVAAAFQ